MKRMEVGKRVKKLLGQNKDLEFIAKVINSNRTDKLTPKQCLDAYYRYMGKINPSVKASNNLERLVRQGRKIHLFGATGVGKTYAVQQIAKLLDLTLVMSYARSEEDLIQDFGNLPFEQNEGFLFMLEGDAYYWRKYGLIRKYIQQSTAPFVVITEYKSTPTKNITKHLTQVKMFAPTPQEIADYFSKLDGEHYTPQDTFIKEIYNKNWRIVWRNYKYGKSEDDTPKHQLDDISSKEFVYKLLKGRVSYRDFERCEHPFSFILNWLGYNASKFYYSKARYEYVANLLTWLDKNKYNMKQKYLVNTLIENFPKAEQKSYLSFPPYQRLKEEKKESDVVITHDVRAIEENEPKEVEEEIGDFLLV